MKFNDLKDVTISKGTIDALKQMGITQPTMIQEKTIPKILNNQDTHVLAQAKTGSGKTLAFSIPIVELIDQQINKLQSVILVPTRELCTQVADVIKNLTKLHKKIKVVKIYGGVNIKPQIEKIKAGVQIVIATPGRLIDIFKQNKISFKDIKTVVLDEADRMLDMGFFPDVEFLLLKAMKDLEPRLICFSATMFEDIDNLSNNFKHGKKVIKVNVSKDQITVSNCSQFYYYIENYDDKLFDFIRILKKERPRYSMIFVNTKRTGQWLYERLSQREDLNRYKFELLMGSLSQTQREKVLDSFEKKTFNTMICTDVAARGLDIKGVTHVFNYDIPYYDEVYVHRIGRTARVASGKGHTRNQKGVAQTLVLQDEYIYLSKIEGYQGKEIRKLPLPPRFKSKKKQSSKKYEESRRNFLY